jgi:hypothetical protein
MENDAMDDERDPNETDVDQSEADHLTPATESAFELFKNLLALVANEKAFKVRLAGLHRALAAADEAQKRLLSAQSEFAVYEENARGKLGEREAAVRGREVAVSVAEQTVHERQADLVAQGAALRREDAILKRRTMVLGRLDAPGPLQDMPSWKEIAGELLNAESLDLVDEAEVAIERVEHAPADSTLRRATYHPRRSTRRVSAEAS